MAATRKCLCRSLSTAEILWVGVLAVAVLAGVQSSPLPPQADASAAAVARLASFGTGDLIFWRCQHHPHATDGESLIDSDSTAPFTHVGLVVQIDSFPMPLLLEPVVYHHQTVADAVHMRVHTHSAPDMHVHHGGSVRLMTLSERLSQASVSTVGARRLTAQRALGDDHVAEFAQLWAELSALPAGVDLSAHGSFPKLEGEFSARVIASVLQRLKLMSTQRPAHVLTVSELAADTEDMAAYQPLEELQMPQSTSDGAVSQGSSLLESLSSSSNRLYRKLHHRHQHKRAQHSKRITAQGSSDGDGVVEADEKPASGVSGSGSVSEDQDQPLQVSPSANPAAGVVNSQCKVQHCDGRFHQGMLEMRITGASVPGSGRSSFARFFKGDVSAVSARVSQLPRFYGPQSDPVSKPVPLSAKPAEEQRLCMCIYRPVDVAVPDLTLGKIPHAAFQYWGGDYKNAEQHTAFVLHPSIRVVVTGHAKALKLAKTSDEMAEVRWKLEDVLSAASKSPNKPIKYPMYKLGNYTADEQIKGAELAVAFNFQSISSNSTECTAGSQCAVPAETRWEQTYPTWSSTLRSGDALIFRSMYLTGKILRVLLRSKVNHAGVVWVDSKYGIKLMLASGNHGLGLSSLQHYIYSGMIASALKREVFLHYHELGMDLNEEGEVRKLNLPEGRSKYEIVMHRKLKPLMRALGKPYQKPSLEFLQAGTRHWPAWIRTLLRLRENSEADAQSLFCSETGVYFIISHVIDHIAVL